MFRLTVIMINAVVLSVINNNNINNIKCMSTYKIFSLVLYFWVRTYLHVLYYNSFTLMNVALPSNVRHKTLVLIMIDQVGWKKSSLLQKNTKIMTICRDN